MRVTHWVALVFALAVSTVALAQPFGGPFGGGGNLVMLLRQESVQQELKLSAEQMRKIENLSDKMRESFGEIFGLEEPERGKKVQELFRANDKVIAGILKADQLKRLKQISYQQQGPAAFNDPDVAKALQLSDAQRKDIQKVNDSANSEIAKLFEGGPPDDDGRKKADDLRKAAADKIMKRLTSAQAAQWKELLGKPFTGEIGFRRRGGGGPSAGAAAPLPELADAATMFFNGKDLDGWDGLMQYWSVKDGAIVGRTEKDPGFNTFLCTNKSYKDFELKFKVRLKGGIGNSGVQIHSGIVDKDKFIVRGPQCDIGQQFWGSLVGERMNPLFIKRSPGDLVKKVVKPDDFNDYYVKCLGKHVAIKINGETMVDGDFPNLPDRGIIGWQLHAGFKSMEVTFKDIEFTNLSPRPPDKPPTATAALALKIAKDFKVELLYSVPKDKQGSWVNMTVDPKGRLIVSDQYGPLYRITPSPLTPNPSPARGEGSSSSPVSPGGRGVGGEGDSQTRIEKLDLALGGAHGLLWAFDSLYVMVNEGPTISGVKTKRGLHRVRSRHGGDTFESPEFLHEVQGGGEHGPHAVVLAPDGKSLYVLCGNDTRMVNPLAGSLVPRLWGEDHLLPRLPDGNGFMRGRLGPGGCIYRVDPDGKNWELVSTGYRNPFDIAFNRHGELFTYDADMEWDMNTPWYRPTRVCLVTSGSEFGWRNGAGKWFPYYPDSLPAIYNVGPGSPTGITFGYGARFPAKYQEALFLCDWSYGKLYALHLTPEGSAYRAEMEEFLNGSPLPLTDVVVNPKDGALYFTIGGRRTQSGLYRVTYAGKESTEPSKGDDRGAEARALRHKLEAFHGHSDPKAVETAWPYLSHQDRFIRYAARTAIEHQEPKEWQDRASKESDPAKAIPALLALVRATGQDPFHHPRKPGDPVPGAELKTPVLEALARMDFATLPESQRLDLLRVYAILFNRMGKPEEPARQKLIARLDAQYPAKSRELNAEVCQTLVYLEAPSVVDKTLDLLAAAPTQEEQLEYARSLRVLKTGWTSTQRGQYFDWLQKASRYKGGASFRGFLRLTLDDAIASLSDTEKSALLKSTMQTLMAASAATPPAAKQRPFVKKWKLDELTPIVEKGVNKRDFDRGRKLFGEAQCFACHRFDNEGGSQAPDLTIVSGRYSVRDLLEKVLDPNKAISDQYAAVTIVTTDGRTVTGRIVNYAGDGMSVMPNMLDPNGLVNVSHKRVESIEKSNVSMMPEGLLDTFKEDEILDLVAYLLSRGDRNHKMFARAAGGESR
jgi:putative heme-binding domain-containing protein